MLLVSENNEFKSLVMEGGCALCAGDMIMPLYSKIYI
ncbi:hypothetical protein TSAR_013705 [Trichomalopsis sarcophagae]|uniref:Uncharacterized protein n=1 Tax=Trichomalopsis sarcophagae TaxID=543379 RepID=A0A232FLN3_9HYME|nr:hypothetical protein TSAR_013705 [Trichomalopsis sarcophagae]